MRMSSLKTGICILLMLAGILFTKSVVKADYDLSDSTKAGDIIHFGKYMQSSQNDDWSDLEWRVLEREDNRVLLLSEYCLQAMPYQVSDASQNLESMKVTWADCSLRNWLNQDFYIQAFSDEERNSIVQTAIHTDDNNYPETAIDGGSDADDYIFLLDEGEVKKYLEKKTERQAQATDLVINGDSSTIFVSEETDQTVFWWLRSPGDEQDCVQVVGAEGSIALSGFLATRIDIGVRPAMWVNIPEST